MISWSHAVTTISIAVSGSLRYVVGDIYNHPIGNIWGVYKWYILPIGGLYGTYHLLREPGNSIDNIYVFFFFIGSLSGLEREIHWFLGVLMYQSWTHVPIAISAIADLEWLAMTLNRTSIYYIAYILFVSTHLISCGWLYHVSSCEACKCIMRSSYEILPWSF